MILVRQINGTDFAKLVKVVAKILFRNRLIHDATDVQRRDTRGTKKEKDKRIWMEIGVEDREG